MRSIGEVARVSGLSVSALRFYDGAGVLVPAEVDAFTGYRRYAADQVRAARLIAGLRRVSLPAAALAATIDAVRFAAGADPALPMLQCVLLDVTDGELTLVATDR